MGCSISLIKDHTLMCMIDSRHGTWQPRIKAEPATQYRPSIDASRSGTNLSVRQFLVVTLGDASQSTPAISKTLNPEWNQSFDLPIVGLQSLLLEAVCWDKDRFGKDYLGEFAIPLDEIFANGQTAQEVSRFREPKEVATDITSQNGTN